MVEGRPIFRGVLETQASVQFEQVAPDGVCANGVAQSFPSTWTGFMDG
jgi:hypothetical protein